MIYHFAITKHKTSVTIQYFNNTAHKVNDTKHKTTGTKYETNDAIYYFKITK